MVRINSYRLIWDGDSDWPQQVVLVILCSSVESPCCCLQMFLAGNSRIVVVVGCCLLVVVCCLLFVVCCLLFLLFLLFLLLLLLWLLLAFLVAERHWLRQNWTENRCSSTYTSWADGWRMPYLRRFSRSRLPTGMRTLQCRGWKLAVHGAWDVPLRLVAWKMIL